jgi:quinohemoprotein ethanol dehydrogenase
MGEVSDRLKTALSGRYAIEREIGAGGMATTDQPREPTMTARALRFAGALFVALTQLTGCTSAEARPASAIDDEYLAAADRDSANWLTYGRTYEEQRFSPLSQIRDDNVGRLGLVWSMELGTTRGIEATPLVLNGILYTTGPWSLVYAIDARTGERLWTYDPQVPKAHGRFACCDVVNRGLALYRGKVYVGTIDGRLVALDVQSGQPVWTTQTTPVDQAYTITGAPRIANGMVVIGNGGAEYGVRGYVSAYDAETGELRWRTYTVPGDPSKGFESEAMERAAATWNGQWWTAGGGGTAWDAIVFDPELDIVYVGTGNGSPWNRDLRSPGGGDNLYLSSILALRADDGSLLWHYQTTPGDHWDYTATQPLMLADLQIGGRARKVIMQAPKNGFFYVLDRGTGELLSAKPFADINWATGVDLTTGRPVESPTAYREKDAVVVSPGPQGAHNWYPMAFNPATGLVYLPTRDKDFALHAPDLNWKYDERWWNTGRDPFYDGPARAERANAPLPIGRLIAWDPVAGREVWGVRSPVLTNGGVLTTAGNLVLEGRSDGVFAAYRATDGEVLWQFDAGTGVSAPPITYLLDGVQYVTVMVGWGGAAGLGNGNPAVIGPVKPGYGRVLTFALDANAQLTVPAFGHTEPPAPAIQMNASPQEIQLGATLYGTFCSGCHGAQAVAGPLPDLRYLTAATHARLENIVLEGEREALGMPSFNGLISREQLRAIQAYILSRAAAASTQTASARGSAGE